MLEIYCTLKKTLHLWRRYFWLLTIITFITETPNVLMRCWIALHLHSHSPGYQLIQTTHGILIGPFLYAVNSSAVLGLLAKSHNSETSFNAIFKSIRSYTWTMFRLFLLIVLVIIAALIPLGLLLGVLTKFIGMVKVVPLLLSGFYLILIKYALANPLVVVEKMEALPALRRSWEMTKGHFWYVAGCYLSIGVSVRLVRWVVYLTICGSTYDAANFKPLAEILLVLIEPVWLVVAWCMYHDIRRMDAQE